MFTIRKQACLDWSRAPEGGRFLMREGGVDMRSHLQPGRLWGTSHCFEIHPSSSISLSEMDKLDKDTPMLRCAGVVSCLAEEDSRRSIR